MPRLAITTDRVWYHVDVYEPRGTALVKIGKKTFQTTEGTATDLVANIASQNPTATVNAYRWDPSIRRWQKWR